MKKDENEKSVKTKKEVLLESDDQRKLKIFTKVIAVVAKIGRVFTYIGVVGILLLALIVPYFIGNIDIKDNEITWKKSNNKILIEDIDGKGVTIKYDNNVILEESNNDLILNYRDIFKKHSNLSIIICLELSLIIIIATLIVTSFILKHIESLCNNINSKETPFTMENVEHIRKAAHLMIAAVVLPYLSDILISILIDTDTDINFQLFNVVEILFLFSISYIFKYGYELQKNTNSKIYD